MSHDHDQGLHHDLVVLANQLDRRQLLGWLAAGTVLAACDPGSLDTTGSSDTQSDDTGLVGGECVTGTEIPSETGGPYPGDGTNGPNVLVQSGIVRQDIRDSFGSASGTATGPTLRIRLRLVDAATCEPIVGAAVYLWHCDKDGLYSMYTAPNANYLRGVQISDSNGELSFTSIFPGCYPGRWPHAHFEVYANEAEAVAAGTPLVTSQLGLPEDKCIEAYEADGYDDSVQNLGNITLASDNVFRDGWDQQIAETTGSVDDGFVCELIVPVFT